MFFLVFYLPRLWHCGWLRTWGTVSQTNPKQNRKFPNSKVVSLKKGGLKTLKGGSIAYHCFNAQDLSRFGTCPTSGIPLETPALDGWRASASKPQTIDATFRQVTLRSSWRHGNIWGNIQEEGRILPASYAANCRNAAWRIYGNSMKFS